MSRVRITRNKKFKMSLSISKMSWLPFVNVCSDGLDLYRKYLITARQIVQRQNEKATLGVYLILGLLSGVTVQKLLTVHYGIDSMVDAVALADVFYVGLGFQSLHRDKLNSFAVLILLLGIYYHWRFYLHADTRAIEHYWKLLFDQQHYVWLYAKYRGAPVRQLMRTFATRIASLLRPFYMLVYLSGIYAEILFAAPIIDNWRYFFGSLPGAGRLLLHWLCMAASCACLYSFAHIAILVLCFGVVGLRALYIHASQHNRLLQHASRQSSARWVAPFIRSDITLFVVLIRANRTFAPLFLTFLVVNIPINAFLLLLLLDGAVEGGRALLCCAFFCHQLVGILATHLYIARFSLSLYQSGKWLTHIWVHWQASVRNLRTRFALARTIERLQCKRKLGCTYGMLGLVTVGSFAKCLLFYGEFLMYFYQLIRK